MSKHRFDIARKMKMEAERREKLREGRDAWYKERVKREASRADAYKKQQELFARQREAAAIAAKEVKWRTFTDEVRRIKQLSAAMEMAWRDTSSVYMQSRWPGWAEVDVVKKPWAETTGSLDIVSALEARE